MKYIKLDSNGNEISPTKIVDEIWAMLDGATVYEVKIILETLKKYCDTKAICHVQ
ncbi:MAG: hypothetical protein IPK18_07095 [Sphingobacteriales bacterium]|jgi:hypothetical protein|nr:MAG: hypothetical protein IPK18_07095 [Sphingobacteriales bacterium]